MRAIARTHVSTRATSLMRAIARAQVSTRATSLMRAENSTHQFCF